MKVNGFWKRMLLVPNSTPISKSGPRWEVSKIRDKGIMGGINAHVLHTKISLGSGTGVLR